MFDNLTKKIEEGLHSKVPVVVGISGFGGAGKTTLANGLRDHFGIADAQVVRLDNIFAEDQANKPIFEDYDWPTIMQILKLAKRGDRLQYQGRGLLGERFDFDEPLPHVVIVEGVRLFRPDVMSYFDIAVWIDCPPDVATLRGEARDRANGLGEQHVGQWRTSWLPKSQYYFDTYKPKELATFLYAQ